MQKLNANTKLQKLKGRRNTEIIAETERKYQIAEVEGKMKYQIFQKRNKKYHSNFFFAEVGSAKAVFEIKFRSIKPTLIPC